jgi:hydrogenase nickel incorporation protein HypA/HybF
MSDRLMFMHELSIVKKIIETAADAAKKAKIKSVNVIRIKVGKMVGLEAEQLTILFDTFEKNDSFTETKLEIEEIPVELKCLKCGHFFTDERFNNHNFAHSTSHAPVAYESPPCPKCTADKAEIIRGQELDLIDLEGE